jgi:hypothetical protein
VSAFSKDGTLGQDEFKEIGIAESVFTFFLLLLSHESLPGHFHGSIFVSIHARAFLDSKIFLPVPTHIDSSTNSDYLADSTFVNDLDHIVSCFDTTTKLRFRSDDGPEYIKFGFGRDNDYAHGIRFGQVKLDGFISFLSPSYYPSNRLAHRSDVREFFRPSVKCIIDAIEEQWKSAHGNVTVCCHCPLFVSTFSPSIRSMSCWLAGLLPTTGYTTRSIKHLNCSALILSGLRMRCTSLLPSTGYLLVSYFAQ